MVRRAPHARARPTGASSSPRWAEQWGLRPPPVVACAVFLAITRRWRPCRLYGNADGRRDHGVPGRRGDRQAPPARCNPPGPAPAHLGLPVRPHGRHLLHLRRASRSWSSACPEGWWRWLFLIPAVALPILVALSRVYRGEHHPTDVLAAHAVRGTVADGRHPAHPARRRLAGSASIKPVAGRGFGNSAPGQASGRRRRRRERLIRLSPPASRALDRSQVVMPGANCRRSQLWRIQVRVSAAVCPASGKLWRRRVSTTRSGMR